jgi:exosortase E/protease (VPEID-CTERM system)
MRLYLRLALIAALLLLEKAVLNLFVDFDAAQQAQGLGALLRGAQHWGFRFAVSFVIATLLFGYLRAGTALAAADQAARAAPVRLRWLALHFALLLPLVPLSMSLYGRESALPLAGVVVLWVLLAALATLALFAALAPWTYWRRGALALGALWGYAALAAAGSVVAMGWSQRLWLPTANLTFQVVYRLLRWFIPDLLLDPVYRVIDTGRFAVSIDPVCSGLEGLGLMLAFCVALLLLFRQEYRFPRALLLIPAGLLLSFALNVLRIAALVLIGDRGHPDVAIYGFHSQAGWIAFNAAAAGVALVSLRSKWLTRAAGTGAAAENPTAVYLLPYLALLLAGMLSRAASNGLETFYWPSVIAFAAAFCYSGPRLRGLAWRCSWRGALAGLVAFALFEVATKILGQATAVPGALGPLPRQGMGLHLIAWAALGVLAVPVAQELALRGFLLRRLRAVEFDLLRPTQAGLWPWLVSSLVAGLLQGPQWLPGLLAALVFGLVFVRTERLGEAVLAHVVVNALISVSVVGA